MRHLRIVFCAVILLFVTGFASAQQQDQLSTVAGTGTSNPFFTSTANLAGVATDSSGNVFIVDYSDCAVYEFSGGTLTPIAGTPGSCGYSGDGGAATSAQLGIPIGVALDSAGNLYIADFGNNAIREVTAPLATGTISTIAGDGTGNCGYSGDGGAATSAELCGPSGVAVDVSGDVFIADTDNNVIREVVGGTINTVAGDGTANFMDESTGAPLTAEFNNLQGISLDGMGNLYIADTNNNRVRKFDTSGNVTTVAGNGSSGFGSDGVLATSTSLNGPFNVTIDGAGDLTITDLGNNRVRWVDTAGIIQTVAGNGVLGASTPGPATASDLGGPYGVAVDNAGNIYFSDLFNFQLDKVTAVSELSSSATSLTFATQAVGTSSLGQSVVLTATGFDLNISGITFAGTNPGDFTETDTCPRGILASGNTCSVSVSFAPTAGGTRTGSLVISDNSFLATSVTVALSGIATSVSLAPPSLTFAAQPVGTSSSPQSVVLTNNGTGSLTMGAISVSGDFIVSSNDCTGTLVGGTACSIGIEFKPTATGTRAGSLSISDSDPTSAQLVSLQGTGSEIKLSPASLTFASRIVDTTSAAQVITVSNITPTASTLSASFSGTNAADFQIQATGTTCTSSLAAGKSCKYEVNFTPSVNGSETASLDVTGSLGTASASLQGTGTTTGVASISPVTDVFAALLQGTTSAAKVITVTNKTSASMTTSPSFSGTNASDFQVSSGGTCTGTIAPKGKCTYNIVFTPSIVGAETATFDVNDGFGTLTVALKGTGTTIVKLTPASEDFGIVQVGNHIVGTAIKLMNKSHTLTLSIDSIVISGTNASDFMQSNTCGSSVAPAKNCEITVTFSPAGTGARSATVQITDNGGGSPQIINLTGTGE